MYDEALKFENIGIDLFPENADLYFNRSITNSN